ncbi:hypothetical protein [Streptomyces phaeofaciens]|uniref:hypothetical protein n=1 Tax=Streptomyces phaeofaciens TaxID=68254 RepID=UPI0036875487
MSSAPPPTPPNPPQPAQPGPIVTQHTAIVLLAGGFIGLVVGCLTFLSGTPAAGAVLAGLLSAGGSVPVLRSLIG